MAAAADASQDAHETVRGYGRVEFHDPCEHHAGLADHALLRRAARAMGCLSYGPLDWEIRVAGGWERLRVWLVSRVWPDWPAPRARV